MAATLMAFSRDEDVVVLAADRTTVLYSPEGAAGGSADGGGGGASSPAPPTAGVKRKRARAAASAGGGGGEEEEGGEAPACLCRQTDEGGEFYIGCNGCVEWFHPDCVGLPMAATKKEAEKKKSAMLESWLCPACSKEPKQPLPGSKAAALGVDWEAFAAPPPPPKKAAGSGKLVLKRGKREESSARVTLRALGVEDAVWRAGLDGAEAAAFREHYGTRKQPLSYSVVDLFLKE
jgi:hypothetical protein